MSSFMCLAGLILALVAIGATSDDCAADDEEPWSYRGSENGPDDWAKLFPEDCSGKKQSPIDLDSDSAENKNIEPLGFNNYPIPILSATMVNNGHTVQLMPDDRVRRTIIVDGDEYALTQFHFHWGLDNDEGSEHTLDGDAFLMEVHFVHESSDGRIAVVGVFFSKSLPNISLQPIVNSLRNVRYKNSRTSLRLPLVLSTLLPRRKSFFRYDGSLTTPNCTEGVTWSVMSSPIPVSKSQMKEFRKLFSVSEEEASEDENEDCLIAPNYRPVQPLNGRTVYYSK